MHEGAIMRLTLDDIDIRFIDLESVGTDKDSCRNGEGLND